MATYDAFTTLDLVGALTLGAKTHTGIAVTDAPATLRGDDTTVLGDVASDRFRAPTGLLGSDLGYEYKGVVYANGTTPIGFMGASGPLGSEIYKVFIVSGTAPSNLTLSVLPSDATRSNTQWDLDNGEPVCFYPGTLIAVPSGEVPVEALKPGDLVLTVDGPAAPVRWMGRQTVSTRFADPLKALPVRVRAGALAENTPARDLLVSPAHALLVGGVLVQAGALVNGASVLREPKGDPPEIFTYWHVELAEHSLILAEGAPAETFVDNVGRDAFDNWAEHEALGGHGAPMAEMELPRAKARRQVPPAVRQHLEARAGALYGEAGTAAAA